MKTSVGQPWVDAAPAVNVGGAERMACGVVAGWLVARALRRETAAPVALLLAAAFIYRGLSGHCAGYRACGISTCLRK
jgi:hypothetical protein